MTYDITHTLERIFRFRYLREADEAWGEIGDRKWNKGDTCTYDGRICNKLMGE
jgi:hypothetical protein